MPLTRYRVRSEYGLADPELYRAADKDDPEALLEGVAMAGLVGVLRQLGDLAEFAAEIFHDLHEEVLATAARGHGLITRVQQLEAEFPRIEKALLSQTNQSLFHYNAGVDWHPNLRAEQNLVARGDLPRFVMDSYEESRGPPRLFLLDKFDVAGAGACLKRYTDPSFFKVEAAASGKENLEIPREKKNHRFKKKGARWRNGENTTDALPTSHTRLEQLFLEERIENGHSDPARLVKLKRRHVNGSVVDHGAGKSYMERFVETPEEREVAYENSIVPVSYTPEYSSESGVRILDISTVSPGGKSLRSESACSSPNIHEIASKSSTNGYGNDMGDAEIIKMTDTSVNDATSDRSSSVHEVQVEREVRVYGEEKRKAIVNGYESDDLTSEVDNYLDAVASMESEIETDNEYRPNSTTRFLKDVNRGTDSEANEEPTERRAQLSDSQSVGNCSTSDEGNNSFKRNRSSFSYSDSPSSLVEKTRVASDSGAVFPSRELRGSEIVEDSFNGLSENSESLGAIPDNLVVSPDTTDKEENFHPYREASGSAIVNESHPIKQDGFAAASSVEAASLEGSDLRVRNTAENEANLVDAAAAEPHISSPTSEDSAKTPERDPADESEAKDPKVLEPASENEVCEIKEELQETEKDSGSDEGEPQGISHEELCSSPWANSGTSIPYFSVSRDRLDILEPEKLAPAVEDIVTPVELHTDEFSPTLVAEEKYTQEEGYRGDSSQTTGITEPHYLDFTENNEPLLEEASVELPKESLKSETGPSTIQNISLPSDACSPSKTTNLEEPLLSTVAPHQQEAEFLERVSPECNVESETSREEDLGLTPRISDFYRHNPGTCGGNDDSLPAEKTQNSFPVVDNAEASSSFEAEDQKTESVPSDHFINREDIMSLPTSHQPEDSLELPVDHVSAESPLIDEASPHYLRATQLNAERLEVDEASVDSSSSVSKNIYMGNDVDERTAFRKDSSSVSPQAEELDRSSVLEFSSESAGHEVKSTNQVSNPFEHVIPVFPEVAQVDLAEMPPLPPLPPMQWRMGLGTGTGLGMGMGSFQSTPFQGNRGFFSAMQPIRADEKAEAELPVPHIATQQLENPVLTGMESFQSTPFQGSRGFFSAMQPIKADEKAEAELPVSHIAPQQLENSVLMGMGSFQSTLIQGDTGFSPVIHPLMGDEKAEEEFSVPQTAENSVFPLAIGEDERPSHVPQSAEANQNNPFASSPPKISSKRHEEEEEEAQESAPSSFVQPQTTECATELNLNVPEETNHLPSQPDPDGEQGSLVAVEEHAPLGLVMPIWSSNKSESQKENGKTVPKIPRPRNPLIDEVNAHGTSKLRKVAERVRPQLGPKVDERDSLLEQIRTKSFSLKPTTATRPNMGPTFNKTNLRVAAILEKANAIRQSLAGSDDEDDEDNWD